MDSNNPSESREGQDFRKPASPSLRMWPALFLVAVQWVCLTIPTAVAPGEPVAFLGMQIGGLGATALLVAWWLLFSRAPRRDRWIGISVLAVGIVLGLLGGFDPTARHPMTLGLFLLPAALGISVLALALTRVLGWSPSRRIALGSVLGVFVLWSCLRIDGLDGFLSATFAWRWTPSAEQQFLAERSADSKSAVRIDNAPLAITDDDWPGFRGPNRDGQLVGQKLNLDWSIEPPRELWRRRVGPGWSSVCAVGGVLFTQEQRGEFEAVVCYDATTGQERWANQVPARFAEVVGGPGPRATPTFHGGALYATGAEGAVQRIDPATGETHWRRQLTADLPVEEPPGWGFASSPLLLDLPEGRSLAIVYAGNPAPKPEEVQNAKSAVVAYDAESGEVAWRSGVGYHGYSSPQRAELNGVEQVLISTNLGLESLKPSTGERLWFYDWSIGQFPRVVQPKIVDAQTVILAGGYGSGAHGIRVIQGKEGGWSTETLWTTLKLKPYFNDFVLFEGHLYGFDGPFLTCLHATGEEAGQTTWPRRVKRDAKLGHGQVLLLADAGLLLATTEETGEALLIEANPTTLVERGRLEALEGKTWNHPVVANGRLFVRNGVEMAAYELRGTQ